MAGTPRTWVSGELVTASIGNTYWRDQFIALRSGEILIASQVALDDIYASSSSQFARLAVGTKFQVRRLNNAGTGYERAAPSWLRAFDDTQAATGANTTETVLYTFSAESSLLNVNGRTLRITAAGTCGANDSEKTIRVRWGGLGGTIAGSIHGETAVLSLTTYTQWSLEVCVSRIASNSQRLYGIGRLTSTTDDNFPLRQQIVTTAAITETGVITLVVTGQNGSATASDIVYECAWVEMMGGPA